MMTQREFEKSVEEAKIRVQELMAKAQEAFLGKRAFQAEALEALLEEEDGTQTI
jgi:hypothetical protein